jgi:GxxExxY protein
LAEEMNIESLATAAVDCAFHIHRKVGPGLFESVYESVLTKKLSERGFAVEKQKAIPAQIEGIAFGEAFRADLVVNGKLLIEIKSVEKFAPIHVKQTLTYLRLMNLPLGLLINFGCDQFKDGVKRIMNNHTENK